MKVFVLLLNLLLFTSCTEQQVTTVDYASSAHKNLAENKKLWKKRDIQNYTFVVEKSCFCPHEEKRQISVKSSQVYEAKYIPSNTPLSDKTKVKKISDYFDIIQDALDRDAYKVTVTYDKRYGFPSDISIDYDKQIADEEVYYQITHFVTALSYEDVVCTKEYMPVCAEVTLSCETRPCATIEKGFSNSCMLNATPNAVYLREGEC